MFSQSPGLLEREKLFHYMLGRTRSSPPDRTFHKLGASNPGDRRTLCGPETSITEFRGFRNVKCAVRQLNIIITCELKEMGGTYFRVPGELLSGQTSSYMHTYMNASEWKLIISYAQCIFFEVQDKSDGQFLQESRENPRGGSESILSVQAEKLPFLLLQFMQGFHWVGTAEILMV